MVGGPRIAQAAWPVPIIRSCGIGITASVPQRAETHGDSGARPRIARMAADTGAAAAGKLAKVARAVGFGQLGRVVKSANFQAA